MVSERPRSRIGRAQFPTLARAWDQASKSPEVSSPTSSRSTFADTAGISSAASSPNPGNTSGSSAGKTSWTTARVRVLIGLTTPKGVPRGYCGPAARHTRFGRTTITGGEQTSTQGPPQRRDTTNQGVRGRKSSVRVLCAALHVWPLATVGSRPPGNMPHQFSSGLELSSPTRMTPTTDNCGRHAESPGETSGCLPS